MVVLNNDLNLKSISVITALSSFFFHTDHHCGSDWSLCGSINGQRFPGHEGKNTKMFVWAGLNFRQDVVKTVGRFDRESLFSREIEKDKDGASSRWPTSPEDVPSVMTMEQSTKKNRQRILTLCCFQYSFNDYAWHIKRLKITTSKDLRQNPRYKVWVQVHQHYSWVHLFLYFIYYLSSTVILVSLSFIDNWGFPYTPKKKKEREKEKDLTPIF